MYRNDPPSDDPDVERLGDDDSDVEDQVLYDAMTGLPIPELYHQRLGHALERGERRSTSVGVGVVDLDNFEAVNRLMGREAGDAALAEAARRMETALDESDTVARLSGDCFGLVLLEAHSRSAINDAADRLMEAFDPPFVSGDARIHVSLSMGFALKSNLAARADDHPDRTSEESADELMETARRAMRCAKRATGHSRRTMMLDTPARSETPDGLADDIRPGIERGEFSPYFQPIFTIDGDLRGLEMLARWNHSEHGVLRPVDFLEVAEQTGALRPLTERLLAQTFRTVDESSLPSDWPNPIPIHLNLQPMQLARRDAVQHLNGLSESNAPDSVEIALEISETQVSERRDRVRSLSDAGFHIVVDNFGEGWSQLDRIGDCHIDELKLGRTFVHGAVNSRDDAAVLHAVEVFGRELGIPVVGGGVENADQLASLRGAGYDAAQGYFLGRPAPFRTAVTRLYSADPTSRDHSAGAETESTPESSSPKAAD